MGSADTRDPLALPEEFPQHIVSLPTYEIGRYPVTVAEYAYALAAGAPGLLAPVNWAQQREFLLHPVSGLTWYDAVAYARWLAAQAGEHWRLPTEAEWEQAARGTDGRIYPWGDTWDPDRANALRGNSGETTAIDAHPLGASPYGVLDLVGNIAEWTSTIDDPLRFAYPYRAARHPGRVLATPPRAIACGSPHFISYEGPLGLAARDAPRARQYRTVGIASLMAFWPLSSHCATRTEQICQGFTVRVLT